MKKLGILIVGGLLFISSLTAGCGGSLTPSSSAQGFSNYDTARGLVLSLLSILDGLLPLGTGPTEAKYIRRACPFDNEWFDVYYTVTSTTTAPIITSFYTTSSNSHYIKLGSSSDQCKVSIDSTTDTYTINLKGLSSSLHSPSISFRADATGTVDGVTIFSGTVLMWYVLNSQNICTGSFVENFEGTDVVITIILDENNDFGRSGKITFNYQPSSGYLASRFINGKQAVGRILIEGTAGFDGEYLFNEDYQFDRLFSE